MYNHILGSTQSSDFTFHISALVTCGSGINIQSQLPSPRSVRHTASNVLSPHLKNIFRRFTQIYVVIYFMRNHNKWHLLGLYWLRQNFLLFRVFRCLRFYPFCIFNIIEPLFFVGFLVPGILP